MSKFEDLDSAVSNAIHLAQGLEDIKSEYAPEAWSNVSVIEQLLTNEREYESVEWLIACRGSVRAAVQAGNTERAKNLIEHFRVNFQIDQKLFDELHALLR